MDSPYKAPTSLRQKAMASEFPRPIGRCSKLANLLRRPVESTVVSGPPLMSSPLTLQSGLRMITACTVSPHFWQASVGVLIILRCGLFLVCTPTRLLRLNR